VRRAVGAYDPENDTREIEAMLEALAASHRGTIAALERAEAELAETRRHFAARRAPDARPEPAGT
jgi:hypothetical protein